MNRQTVFDSPLLRELSIVYELRELAADDSTLYQCLNSYDIGFFKTTDEFLLNLIKMLIKEKKEILKNCIDTIQNSVTKSFVKG